MTSDEFHQMLEAHGIVFVGDAAWRVAQLVAAAEREACVNIIENYRIPVGNSAAGELACEWTYDALENIRDSIRARGQS